MHEIISTLTNDNLIYNHSIYKNIDKDYFKPHTHTVWEIIYLIDGDISYITDGAAHKMKKQELYFVAPAVQHRIRPDSCSIYERYDLLPPNEDIPDTLKQMIAKNAPFFSLPATQEIENIFKRMDIYYSLFAEPELSSLYSCLTKELLYNIQLCMAQTQYPEYPQLIHKALRYIDDNLLAISDIDGICKHLFISKSYFQHTFTEVMKISPMNYIRRKRLMLARDAIRAGAKASAVYSHYGFSDYSSFYRSYRSFFGKPPSEEKQNFELS